LKTGISVAHLNIDRDEVRLDIVNHFQCDKERNRHEVHKSNKPDASLRQDLYS
jgi:hypothetical protein